MSDPNAQTPPQSSLLNRVRTHQLTGQANATANNNANNTNTANNANQNQNQNNQGNNANNNPFNSRFSRQQNQNQNQQQQPPPRPTRTPFGQNGASCVWTIQPAHSTLVRFQLRGLGDPFHRLLGTPLDTENGHLDKLVARLEAGGVQVDALKAKLDGLWADYQLNGAVLVYPWNASTWEQLNAVAPRPEGEEDNLDWLEEQNEGDADQPQKPRFNCLYAIDPGLTLNVLLRARSQLLLAQAPVVFSSSYLRRSLMTDDPRLVAIVRATGYIAEEVPNASHA